MNSTPASAATTTTGHFFTPGATPTYETADFDCDCDNQTLLLFPDTPAAQRDNDLDDFILPQQQPQQQPQEEEAEDIEESSSPYSPYVTTTGLRRQRQEILEAQEAHDKASLERHEVSLERIFLQSMADAAEATVAHLPDIISLPDISLTVNLPNGCVVTLGNVAAHLLPQYLQLINTGVFNVPSNAYFKPPPPGAAN